MQTQAEAEMVAKIVNLINLKETPKILNIGSGKDISIEQQLNHAGCKYTVDRLDIEPCQIDFINVNRCWTFPVEDMPQVNSSFYDAAFANYVLEHVGDIQKAAKEIYRILVPGGYFLATVPNPAAPEFIIAKNTPVGTHKRFRKQMAWKTIYAYKSIKNLCRIFENAGFKFVDLNYFPAVGNYLSPYPLLSIAGKIYDRVLNKIKITNLLGQVCVIFQKLATID